MWKKKITFKKIHVIKKNFSLKYVYSNISVGKSSQMEVQSSNHERNTLRNFIAKTSIIKTPFLKPVTQRASSDERSQTEITAKHKGHRN